MKQRNITDYFKKATPGAEKTSPKSNHSEKSPEKRTSPKSVLSPEVTRQRDPRVKVQTPPLPIEPIPIDFYTNDEEILVDELPESPKKQPTPVKGLEIAVEKLESPPAAAMDRKSVVVVSDSEDDDLPATPVAKKPSPKKSQFSVEPVKAQEAPKTIETIIISDSDEDDLPAAPIIRQVPVSKPNAKRSLIQINISSDEEEDFPGFKRPRRTSLRPGATGINKQDGDDNGHRGHFVRSPSPKLAPKTKKKFEVPQVSREFSLDGLLKEKKRRSTVGYDRALLESAIEMSERNAQSLDSEWTHADIMSTPISATKGKNKKLLKNIFGEEAERTVESVIKDNIEAAGMFGLFQQYICPEVTTQIMFDIAGVDEVLALVIEYSKDETMLLELFQSNYIRNTLRCGWGGPPEFYAWLLNMALFHKNELIRRGAMISLLKTMEIGTWSLLPEIAMGICSRVGMNTIESILDHLQAGRLPAETTPKPGIVQIFEGLCELIEGGLPIYEPGEFYGLFKIVVVLNLDSGLASQCYPLQQLLRKLSNSVSPEDTQRLFDQIGTRSAVALLPRLESKKCIGVLDFSERISELNIAAETDYARLHCTLLKLWNELAPRKATFSTTPSPKATRQEIMKAESDVHLLSGRINDARAASRDRTLVKDLLLRFQCLLRGEAGKSGGIAKGQRVQPSVFAALSKSK